MLLCGFLIGYAILVLFASLSFLFINTTTFPKIGEEIIFYKENPHHIYKGALKVIFFYIFPVIFVTSVPASTIVKGIEWRLVLIGILLATLFITITIFTWNRLIRFYSSASS